MNSLQGAETRIFRRNALINPIEGWVPRACGWLQPRAERSEEWLHVSAKSQGLVEGKNSLKWRI